MRKCEQVPTNDRDRPLQNIEIYDSGTLPLKQPFLVAKSDAVYNELDASNVGTIPEMSHGDDFEPETTPSDEYQSF